MPTSNDPTNPEFYVGTRVLPAQPYDQNNRVGMVLMGAIVDPVTHEITGYLPIKCINNNDGTCSITAHTV